jgi:hypothetical protein
MAALFNYFGSSPEVSYWIVRPRCVSLPREILKRFLFITLPKPL